MYSEANEFIEKKSVISEMIKKLQLNNIDLDLLNSSVLDIGGAGGVLGGLLSDKASKVYVSDVVDHQTNYNGEFPKLLKEKFERNSCQLNLSKIEFHTADAMMLPYRDNFFDLVVSLNAFEHIPNPEIAILEALRVTKKGGVIYLTFDPVWTADTGGHFHHFVKIPWGHLLLSSEEYRSKMLQAGAEEKFINEFPDAMNQKAASFYRDNLSKTIYNYGVDKSLISSWSGCVDQTYLMHDNLFNAASLLKVPSEELLIRGFNIIIKK
jgi:ubiquinone/menaquinone biosynthesis C-methylase UbiE